MRQPVVTFVMPAYNAGCFIADAIRSIRLQTVPEWYLIIVDDGSTDDTVHIASAIAEEDPRISILKMECPSGSAYQPRRKAIIASETKFVSPLDADDWIEPDYLEKLLLRQQESGADIVYPTMFEPDGTIITPRDHNIIQTIFKGKDCVRLTLDGWRINCNGGLINKNSYLDTFQRFGDQLTYSCADELLTRQLLFSSSKVAFSDAKYFYRPNEESITHRKSPKLFEFLINNHTLIDFTRDHFSSCSEEYVLAQRQNFHGIFNAYRLMDRFDFDKESVAFATELIEKSQELINHSVVRNSVSKIYYHILTSPILPTRGCLRILDFMKKILTSSLV